MEREKENEAESGGRSVGEEKHVPIIQKREETKDNESWNEISWKPNPTFPSITDAVDLREKEEEVGHFLDSQREKAELAFDTANANRDEWMKLTNEHKENGLKVEE